MTKDSPNTMLFMIVLMLGLLCYALITVGKAVLALAEIELMQAEIMDEQLKLDWQLHGDELDEYYPEDQTVEPEEFNPQSV